MDQESSDRPTVLYVEDHPVNVVLMEAVFLRRPDWHLVTAVNCYQALQLAPRLRPALLLLDLDLPDGHGSELLQRLRLHAGYQAAPAIAVTADRDYDIAGTGFLELWPKPLDLPHVFARLDAFSAMGSAARAAVLPASPVRAVGALHAARAPCRLLQA